MPDIGLRQLVAQCMYFQLNVESESPKVMASPAWRVNHEIHTRRETDARVRG
jgi:hypothetical protein